MQRSNHSEILGDIPADITKLMMDITRIRSMEGIRRINYPKDYSRMEDIARLASVKYSNEIEGIVTSDERIREIVLRGGAPKDHSEEEIAGYRNALDLIHRESDRLGFNRDTILNLHSLLKTKGSNGSITNCVETNSHTRHIFSHFGFRLGNSGN